MKIHTSSFDVLALLTVIGIVLLFAEVISNVPVQSANAQRQGLVNNQTDTGQNVTKTILISVTEEEVYRWSNVQGTNPTMRFLTNVNNTVLILNPTDEKHEMIIESNSNEVASSGDIAPSSSGQVSFSPNMIGTLEYHCEYHPDTMKGTVMVNRE
jgi:plastocyanin